MLRSIAESGKTSLSGAWALRRVVAGDRVLYVCFNKNLRGFLEGSLEPRVHLWTFLDLLEADLPAGRRPELQQDRSLQNDYFQRALPEGYLDFARETGQQSQFNCLVVDEGQDLLRPAYVGCLDLMVRGGLRGGRWQIFYDPAFKDCGASINSPWPDWPIPALSTPDSIMHSGCADAGPWMRTRDEWSRWTTTYRRLPSSGRR